MNPILDVLWSEMHRAAGLKGRDRNHIFPCLFLDICQALSPQISIEVGAHDADFSRRIKQRYASVDSYAFEANPLVYSRYARSIPDNIAYINKAVSADSKNREFHIPRSIPNPHGERRLSAGNPVGSLLRRCTVGVQYDVIRSECTSLDALHQQLGWPPSVLWIDVEGAAGDVLVGAFRALSRSVRAAVVEVETIPAWTGQWLAAGVISFMEGLGFYPAVRDLEGPWQYNWIFIRSECMGGQIEALIRTYVDDLLSRAAQGN